MADSRKPFFTRRPEDWFSQVRSVGDATTDDIATALAAVDINTTAPITGGGNLSADRTLALSGTKVEFNAACSDGDFLFVGDITAYTDEMARDALGAALVAGSNITITVDDALNTITIDAAISGSGVSDGDYTDITVGGSGTVFTIDNDAVTYAKIQNVSATARVLGRKTAGAGDIEECTLSEILDFIGSAARGDILYRGASAWAKLAAGTAGQVLQTNGAGADPSWGKRPVVCITKFSSLITGTTLTVNSTSYIAMPAQGIFYDVDDMPFTQYRMVWRGQSNEAAQTCSLQLYSGASPLDSTTTADIVFTNGANTTVDSGWRTIDLAIGSGLKQIDLRMKGSNATVDFSYVTPCYIYFR